MTLHPDPVHIAPPALAALPARWLQASWGPVLAGTVIAIAVMISLSECLAGVGLALVHPAHESGAAASTLAIGGACAWIGCGMVALFLGGWVAAHLARRTEPTDGSLLGVMVWGLSTILVVTAGATIAGGVLAGTLGLAGSALHGAGAAVGGLSQGVSSGLARSAAASAAPTFSWDAIKDEAQDLFSTSSTAPQAPAASSSEPPAAESAQGTPAAASTTATSAASGPADAQSQSQPGGKDAAAARPRVHAQPWVWCSVCSAPRMRSAATRTWRGWKMPLSPAAISAASRPTSRSRPGCRMPQPPGRPSMTP